MEGKRHLRRKSHSSIRSPLVKRDIQSQVIIEGWLYKLEGSALKQWKHRWCVLSDFCLFFYKGPDEDKVLASILLPSYKINPCASEDKISKKFSFKAEHQNMKTYYFAADSKENMKQWMNTMSLASIMQKVTRCEMFGEMKPLTNNDDEDSGFTSYRSRRYGPQDPNSTLDSSFMSEPLNQRSNSYGDRMGEIFLGSDDKYPNIFGSHQSHLYRALSVDHDVPNRQPLYANAPPKPRRLTQSDPYAISPSEQYDIMGFGSPRLNSPQSYFEGSQEFSQSHISSPTKSCKNIFSTNDLPPSNHYGTDQSSIGKYPQETFQEFYQNNYSNNDAVNQYDLHKAKISEQPPRPHSADFLERDTECFTVVPRMAKDRGQPPRPKSSLDYYNRFWDSEDYAFSDYRDAVRLQADNLYVVKGIGHNERSYRKWKQDKRARSETKFNISYDESVSPLETTGQTDKIHHLQEYAGRKYQTGYNDNVQPVLGIHCTDKSFEHMPNGIHSKKAHVHEESMKRLLEWKQRMLQSPLTKKVVHRTGSSSETSSPSMPPIRPPLPDEYRQQVLEELESHEACLRTHEIMTQERKNLWHDQNSRKKIFNAFDQVGSYYTNKTVSANKITKPNENSNNYVGNYEIEVKSGIPLTGIEKEVFQKKYIDNDNFPDLSVEKKIMYCVDSDNNEILISYNEDNSQTDIDTYDIKSNVYVHEKQHSQHKLQNESELDKTALPKKSQVLLDQCSEGSEVMELTNMENMILQQPKITPKSQEYFPASAVPSRFNTSYSSDDEDQNMECRRARKSSQAGRARKVSAEASSIKKENFDASSSSSSPDYVNIRMVGEKWKHGQATGMGIRSVPPEHDLSILDKSDDLPDTNQKEESIDMIEPSKCHQEKMFGLQAEIIQPVLSVESIKMKTDTSSNEKSLKYDEKELDIKKEDYYKASQIFYSLPQMKSDKCSISPPYNKEFINQSQEPISINFSKKTISVYCTPKEATETYDSRYRRNIIKSGEWDLDKDVGLPLPSHNSRNARRNSFECFTPNASKFKEGTNFSSSDHSIQNDSPKTVNIATSKYFNSLQMTGEISNVSQNETSPKSIEHNLSMENPKENMEINAAGSQIQVPVKKKFSFEEMRMQLQRQREAPPPNIVQERIKRFESATNDTNTDCTKSHAQKMSASDNFRRERSDELSEEGENFMSCTTVGSKLQDGRIPDHSYKFQRRRLHSDSEANLLHQSDESLSDDGLTMKSAPIMLSPLSSVLADLRRTADTGKDKVKHQNESVSVDEVIITKGALRLSIAETQLELDDSTHESKPPLLQKAIHKFDLDEEEYLPMSGIKGFEEPEYVAMDDNNSSKVLSSTHFSEVSGKTEAMVEEPLYNEPFSPPPSFLHDVYGKQKIKHAQYESDTSSSDDSSENIYEKPKHRIPNLECTKQHNMLTNEETRNENLSTSGNIFKMKSRNMPFLSEKLIEKTSHDSVTCDYNSFCKAGHRKCSVNESGLPQLTDSVPDLLQLEEIKDSDASDADDEASRDFDTSHNLNSPSYQSAILDSYHIVEDESILYKYEDCHSSFDSEIISFSPKHVEGDSTDRELEFTHHMSSNVMQLPTFACNDYQKMQPKHNFSKFGIHEVTKSLDDFYSPEIESIKQNSVDDGKLIHVRKLRVYTKGNKPEGPRLCPVPFNIDESNTQVLTEKSSICDALNLSVNTSPVSQMHDTDENISEFKRSSLDDSFAFSETSCHTANEVVLNHSKLLEGSLSLSSHSSHAPDVIPTEIMEERMRNKNLSRSMRRSPNTPPYYYSDLLPEDEDHSFLMRNLEMSKPEKHISSKSGRTMLNNVRDLSPANISKGDIGRKVNKIHDTRLVLDDKGASNQAAQIKCKKDISGDIASDLKCSLDKLLCSESKFLDAEKNKYEAGHTLEKTRRTNSAFAYFKQRASTPDLKYPCDEPVYENIISYQPHRALQKRLSRSLEGLFESSELLNEKESGAFKVHLTDQNRQENTNPLYENLQFIRQMGASKMSGLVHTPAVVQDTELKSISYPSSSQVKQSNFNNGSLTDLNSSIVSKHSDAENHFYVDKNNQIPAGLQDTNTVNLWETKDHDSDSEFLDQYVLRRVSEQHFFGKHMKDRLNNKPVQPILLDKSFHVPFLQAHKQDDLFEGCQKHALEKENIKFMSDKEMHNYKFMNINESNSIIDTDGGNILSTEQNVAPRRESDDADSLSISSSSVDEASVESESRSKRGKIKMKDSLQRTENNVSDSEIHVRGSCQLKKLVQQSEGLTNRGKRLSISAGDLLGKTHEELVLLLIQLRRNQSRISRAKEKCFLQMETEQKHMKLDTSMQQTHIQNCNELEHQVSQLEKQYEITRPLVNLVDNMVKLGSLYGSTDKRSASFPHLELSTDELQISLENLETSGTINKPHVWAVLLEEEKDLQERLHEMCHLDKALHRETHSFSSLQQDKEMLEYTLHGMKSKILDHQDKPLELQRLRKQQRMIGKELSRVKRLLSQSTKKIEETTAKNAELEHEILLLRQKIQQALKTSSCEKDKNLQSRADLEAELTRVQKVLEELANHRQEISNTVEKLKSEARMKVSLSSSEVRASPTGVAGSAPLPLRKKQQSVYLETDLDTMETRDLASTSAQGRDADIPVYVNAEEINNANQDAFDNGSDFPPEYPPPPLPHTVEQENALQCPMQDISDADEKTKRFYGILPREKPCEIKTVRIVKRESERRNRERDKKRVTYDEQSLVWVVEEPDISSDDHLEMEDVADTLKRTTSLPLGYNRPTSLLLSSYSLYRQSGSQSAHERLFGASAVDKKEETVKSVSPEDNSPTKRSKRRHYTVSGYQYMLDPQFSQFLRERPRSRDDVDMERCLRTANTPDIVRSTIKKTEVFDEKIIERELGLPQKIVIPERYIEEEPEQLSATERLRRSLKAENIRKMLSETTTYEDLAEECGEPPESLHKKLSEEKRKRAHLLALNHALAREVMERSKVVAVLSTLERLNPNFIKAEIMNHVEEDLSPMVPLPITQQRDNYLC